MTGAPIAQRIHDGHGIPPERQRQQICHWLAANDIDPNTVAVNRPISVISVPYTATDPGDEGPWAMQVIVLTAYYPTADGYKEYNLITDEPVTCQRTVPLRVPFPTGSPDDEGTTSGETDSGATEAAPEDSVRDQEQARVSHPRSGSREGGPFQGEAAWNESAAETGSSRGDEAVPQSEEDGEQQPQDGAQQEGVAG